LLAELTGLLTCFTDDIPCFVGGRLGHLPRRVRRRRGDCCGLIRYFVGRRARCVDRTNVPSYHVSSCLFAVSHFETRNGRWLPAGNQRQTRSVSKPLTASAGEELLGQLRRRDGQPAVDEGLSEFALANLPQVDEYGRI